MSEKHRIGTEHNVTRQRTKPRSFDSERSRHPIKNRKRKGDGATARSQIVSVHSVQVSAGVRQTSLEIRKTEEEKGGGTALLSSK